MADTTIRQSDGELYVPLKAVDLGDGTFAAAVAVLAAAGAVAPAISVTTLTSANTEYSISIPTCHAFELKARQAAELRYAFVTGKVAGAVEPYATLPAGAMLFRDTPVAATTLYLASGVAGTVVEVTIWA